MLTCHSAKCDNFYQYLETPHGTIEDDDLDFLDDASPMGSPLNAAFLGPAKRPFRDTSAKALSSSLKLEVHPGELQHFVHMLLTEPALSSSLSTESPSAAETLDSLTETLNLRIMDWHGLDPGRFGGMRLFGHLTVGKPEQVAQELDCYLFEHIIIMVKNRRGATIMIGNKEVPQYNLKGSILFRKHLTHLSEPQDLCLTLNLSVAELPAINLYSNDATELKMWRGAISDLAFGENAS